MHQQADVKDLRYFVAAYEARSFSRAAESLHTVQGNVSLRIHHLEDHLKAKLFKRYRRGVVPTAQGEALYLHAKDLIATLDETERMIRPDP